MEKEISEELDWPSEIKWYMEDPHYSGADESVYRNKYYDG
jgi:hypothetical protein